MKHELSPIKSSVQQATLNLGFCTLQFGFYTEKADLCSSKGIILKLSNREPKRSGGLFNVYTIGLKAIRYNERIKVGFVKRKQIIKKV